MDSCVGKELVKFPEAKFLKGKVECYLADLIDAMIQSLMHYAREGLKTRFVYLVLCCFSHSLERGRRGKREGKDGWFIGECMFVTKGFCLS